MVKPNKCPSADLYHYTQILLFYKYRKFIIIIIIIEVSWKFCKRMECYHLIYCE